VFTQKPNIRTPEAVVESLFAESSKPHPTKRCHRPEQKRVWASLLLSKDAFIAQVQGGSSLPKSSHTLWFLKTWEFCSWLAQLVPLSPPPLHPPS